MSTQNRAFRPLAQTQNIAVSGTAQTQALNYTLGTYAVRVCNVGTQMIYFLPVESGSAAVATANSGIPLPAGQTEIFVLSQGTIGLSVIAGATGSTLYTTCGEGV